MTIRLEFNRIAPGVEIGPHEHDVETVVYLAGGELVFEHGEGLARRTVVRPGDVLYEAPAEVHRVRNEGPLDALALMAAIDPSKVRRYAHGSRVPGWDEAVDLSKAPAEVPDPATTVCSPPSSSSPASESPNLPSSVSVGASPVVPATTTPSGPS